jgi:cyclase
VPVPVIASGGAGSPQHFCAVLKDAGAAAALGASVFHDRQLTIADVKQALQSAGLPVRSQVNEP